MSSTTPLLLMPHTDAFAITRLTISAARFNHDDLGQMHGLSERVTADEAVAKIGSKRRYDDLVRAQRKKNRQSEKPRQK